MRISERSRTYRNTATIVLYSRHCCSDDCISHASRVLLLTYNRRSSQLPLIHICITLCFHYQIPEHSDCVTNGHGVCPIVIPFFHVPEAYG